MSGFDGSLVNEDGRSSLKTIQKIAMGFAQEEAKAQERLQLLQFDSHHTAPPMTS